MVCKGNITFQSFECDYNEVYEAYEEESDSMTTFLPDRDQ